MANLTAAALVFVLGHLVLSSTPVRTPLIRGLGRRGFAGGYSALALGVFVWMLRAYGEAPFIRVWSPPPWTRWVPHLVMPLALLALVLGLFANSPTAMGGRSERLQSGPTGVLRITRHPVLWGFSLWSLSHLAANGDARNIVLMGAVLVLSVAGMWHIDARRRASLGEDWERFAQRTSVVPFGTFPRGSARLCLREIGWKLPLLSVLSWAALVHAHRWLTGVSVLPI